MSSPPSLEALEYVPMSKLPRRILGELIRCYPRRVSATKLADAVYWDDPNGGPEHADESINVTISRDLRPRLARLGWGVGRQHQKHGISLYPLGGAHEQRSLSRR